MNFMICLGNQSTTSLQSIKVHLKPEKTIK